MWRRKCARAEIHQGPHHLFLRPAPIRRDAGLVHIEDGYGTGTGGFDVGRSLSGLSSTWELRQKANRREGYGKDPDTNEHLKGIDGEVRRAKMARSSSTNKVGPPDNGGEKNKLGAATSTKRIRNILRI